jgi:hypothetical protein
MTVTNTETKTQDFLISVSISQRWCSFRPAAGIWMTTTFNEVDRAVAKLTNGDRRRWLARDGVDVNGFTCAGAVK